MDWIVDSPCYDYWSTCGAETISLQFHVSICLPRIGLFPRHIRHTHRHHLHPLLELLRDYVRINHHHHHHPYHHHHHHHTHRHRLHPLLELLRLLKLAFFIFKPIVFIFTIYYFTGTSELPSPCHLLVNNFIRPRYPGTQVPGTRYQVSVGQQSFSSQVPPCHKKVHGAGPLGQEGTFPCQSYFLVNEF